MLDHLRRMHYRQKPKPVLLSPMTVYFLAPVLMLLPRGCRFDHVAPESLRREKYHGIAAIVVLKAAIYRGDRFNRTRGHT